MATTKIYDICTIMINRILLQKNYFKTPPVFVLAPSIVLGIAMVLPPVYLIASAINKRSDLLDVLVGTRTTELFVNTILLILCVSILSILIAVPMAWITTRTDVPFKNFWIVITVLPLVIPSYVGGFVMILALGSRGMLQSILGIRELPDIYGLSGAVLTLTLLSFPYILLPVRAAFVNMDPALEEASLSLGRSKISTFFKITLPHLRTSIMSGTILVALYTLSDFGAVSLLRYETFTWAIYIQYESMFDRTMASGLSIVLVSIAIILLIAESKTRSPNEHYPSVKGVLRPTVQLNLGGWKWLTMSFCSIVMTFSLLLPISVLSYWALRILGSENIMINLWKAAYNSIYISGIATFVTIIASMPIAILTVRYQSKLSSILEKLTYTSFALPGIVVAISLVYFSVHHATPLYQTHFILVFAYMVLFIPLGVGAMRTSLIQLNPNLEESARGLGKNTLQVFLSITLPLIKPGIIAASAMVFLLCMKELPVTLILSPIGFTTLATTIWSTAEEAFFAQAAISSLVLIIVSSIPMLFLIRNRGYRPL
jgi:iron(III) transport system permease protein